MTTPARWRDRTSPANAAIGIVFSEPVTLDPEAAILSCKDATLAPTADPEVFEFVYIPPLPDGECTYTIVGTKVHDVDANDPPDMMAADVPVSFTVCEAADPRRSRSARSTGAAGTRAPIRNDFIELFNREAHRRIGRRLVRPVRWSDGTRDLAGHAVRGRRSPPASTTCPGGGRRGHRPAIPGAGRHGHDRDGQHRPARSRWSRPPPH